MEFCKDTAMIKDKGISCPVQAAPSTNDYIAKCGSSFHNFCQSDYDRSGLVSISAAINRNHVISS